MFCSGWTNNIISAALPGSLSPVWAVSTGDLSSHDGCQRHSYGFTASTEPPRSGRTGLGLASRCEESTQLEQREASIS